MATQKQIKANRQNAQKSTGPKTAEGKAAVSQNAVKHGLFAESVVAGETEAEYEVFHDELLDELAPVGTVETLLAERIASLWWRLRRAERMQNQAIEDMIGRFVTNNSSRSYREYYFRDQGIRSDDPRFDLDGLPLGRIANSDFANGRVLDRMMLYERRIESSLNRAMKELKRFQTIRRIEIQEAQQQNLKKQSQFVPNLMNVMPFMTSYYGDNPAGEAGENKANRSQSRLAPRPALGVEKEKSVTAATG